MATRSEVAYLKDDGTIISSYVHWDGYPSGVGRDLFTSFNSKEKALEIASKGAMSTPFEDAYGDQEADTYSSLEDAIKKLIHSDREYFYIWMNDRWYFTSIRWSDDFEPTFSILENELKAKDEKKSKSE